MCLLWSLHTQTGENNFSNCRLNWQAWISRRHLRVLSCQVAAWVLAAPESHDSQDGHWASLSFSSHCAKSYPLPPAGFNYLDWEEGEGTHLQPLGRVTRRLLCVRACLFTDPVRATRPLMAFSQRGARGPSGVFTVWGPWGCGRGRGQRISQQAEDEIAYWNWK